LSANSVGRLLARLVITAQKPLWKAYQQDPERVRKWVQEDYPAIEKEAKQMKSVRISSVEFFIRHPLYMRLSVLSIMD